MRSRSAAEPAPRGLGSWFGRHGASPSRRERGWPLPGGPSLDVGGVSDRGRVRANNEDAYVIRPVGRAGAEVLLAVADGLGGASGGEVASRLAIETLVAALERGRTERESPAAALRRGFSGAAAQVLRTGSERAELEGLGTTLTAALVRWPWLWLAHAGDSRAYLARDGRLRRLTRDHTLAEKMREDGLVPPGEPVGRLESMLWNAIGGTTEELVVEQHRERLEPGDLLLLCSDGLTRHLSDRELGRRVARAAPAAELADSLARAANAAGGEDNVTVVIARVGPSALS